MIGAVTHRGIATAGASQLVLSVFPGIDLLGRGFEALGFCVVRGPDLLWGGDIRYFHPPGGRFDGVIGGSPCPDFSRARRASPSGDGVAMLAEFRRVVVEAPPLWWLLENVPGVPDVLVDGYSHQRLDLDPRDFGGLQRRPRHFQFGHATGLRLVIPRPAARARRGQTLVAIFSDLPNNRLQDSACLASRSGGRDWARFCELQGLPRDFDLPGLTLAAKYRAVGNGVHVGVAQALAAAVLCPVTVDARLCACGCGRPVLGRAVAAGPACRKRLQRRREL